MGDKLLLRLNIYGTAAIVNASLVTMAFLLPRFRVGKEHRTFGAAAAAVLFLMAMLVAMVVGVVTASGVYKEARRRNEPMPWIGILPLGIFFLGLAVFLVMIT